MATIQISNLIASYGKKNKPVLNISSLEVAHGEVLSIYGPNHTGKSTILKILSGTLRDIHLHAGASVLYDNKSLTDFGPKRVSYLPQRFAETLFPWMSLQKNLRLRHLADDAEAGVMDLAVAELSVALGFRGELEMCDHYGFRSDGEFRHPNHLSGGQQQTLALLRALVPTPAVLILDEPFSAIDNYKGASLRRKLLEFVEGSVTTVFVTHDLDEAIDLADRVVVLKRGDRGCTIANSYSVGARRGGRNLDPQDAHALVDRIRSENGLGT